MIGINLDKTLEDIVVFNNTQSYKQIVDEHISSEYVPGISVGEVEDIDIYCGATKGAKLTKELVEIAYYVLKTEDESEEYFLEPLIDMLKHGKCPCDEK